MVDTRTKGVRDIGKYTHSRLTADNDGAESDLGDAAHGSASRRAAVRGAAARGTKDRSSAAHGAAVGRGGAARGTTARGKAAGTAARAAASCTARGEAGRGRAARDSAAQGMTVGATGAATRLTLPATHDAGDATCSNSRSNSAASPVAPPPDPLNVALPSADSPAQPAILRTPPRHSALFTDVQAAADPLDDIGVYVPIETAAASDASSGDQVSGASPAIDDDFRQYLDNIGDAPLMPTPGQINSLPAPWKACFDGWTIEDNSSEPYV